MPPMGDAGYLIDLACEAGLHELTWQELNAWKQATGSAIGPWEANAIKAISAAYTAAIIEYRDKAVSAPWQPKAMTENAVRNALRRRGKP